MFRLYTEKEAYENICFWEDEKYPNFKSIISKNIDVCLNISDEELDKELKNSESPIYLFLQSSGSSKIPIALDSHFDKIKEDFNEIVKEPRSVFILDIEPTEASQIQKEYGVAVFSEKKIDDLFLKGGFSKEISTGQTIPEGWKNFIQFNFPISNTLIIVDNYLFQNDENNINIGLSNLPNLLDAFLPLELLSIDYQILIVASDANKTKKWWEQKFGSLKIKVNKLRDYTIKLELVLTDVKNKIHKRRIISNYYNGWADKGFDIFKVTNKEVVRGEFDMHLHRVFNNIEDAGDSHYTLSQNGIQKIKKICNTVSSFIQNRGQTSNKRIFGDCNNDKTIKNRLLE